jgi:hypothetical protein
LGLTPKVEQVEQVADGRHVTRHIVLLAALLGIEEVIAATVAERGIEHPVPFDELNEGGVLAVLMADVATGRKGRDGDHRNTGARAKEVHRPDEARVIVASAFVHSDEDRGPITRYGEHSLKIVPTQPLRRGEYALSSRSAFLNLFCFGVDE